MYDCCSTKDSRTTSCLNKCHTKVTIFSRFCMHFNFYGRRRPQFVIAKGYNIWEIIYWLLVTRSRHSRLLPKGHNNWKVTKPGQNVQIIKYILNTYLLLNVYLQIRIYIYQQVFHTNITRLTILLYDLYNFSLLYEHKISDDHSEL